jgi:hypothetical protein
MSKSRHAEAQMIGALNQLEAGARRKMLSPALRNPVNLKLHCAHGW